ncbi:hypothetical protein CU097_003895, partial [Rhizopus azygosporus]
KWNNIKSKFDKEYAKYWQDREKTAHNNKLGKRTRDLVEDIQERIIQQVRASFGETEVENETDEVQTEIADNTPKDKNGSAEANVNWVLKIQKIIRDITDIPSCWQLDL